MTYAPYEPKNFKLYDRVRFVNTSDPNLDGKEGQILGLPCSKVSPPPWFYIVGLDELYEGNMAINITEACLELVE